MFEREDYELFDDPHRGRQMVPCDDDPIFTMPHGTPDSVMWDILRLMRDTYNRGVASGRREKTREILRVLDLNNE